MGVAGAGKTTVGAAFARALGVDFVEGDAYHTAENVARMTSGIPLTDDDRAGWLRLLARRIHEAKDAGTGLVIACSALKRSYRDVLRGAEPDLQLIFLRGPRTLIAARLDGRRDHFMPPALLDSQLAVLEDPSPDEHAWVCDASQSPADLVAALIERVAQRPT